MDAGAAADALVAGVRARPWGLAVVAIDGDDVQIRIDEGRDALTEDTNFQIGSITKTFTGLLLAGAVVRGEVALDTTVGEVLGARAGNAAAATLVDIATHRSGLPRLPPNLVVSDPTDPYAGYDEDDLLAALEQVVLGDRGRVEYSNFGFMLLGLLLREVTGSPYAALLDDRVFKPLEMTSAGCPPVDGDRAPGYSGASETPWWQTNLPGAGGIGMSAVDLGRYLKAYLHPTSEPLLSQAITLATTTHAEAPNAMGLGWHYQGGGWFHDGATGGFCSFAGMHQPSQTAVGLLANGSDAASLDRAGFATLTCMVRERG